MNGGNGTKILVRPRKGRMAAGSCAGMARYFGLDVTLDQAGHRKTRGRKEPGHDAGQDRASVADPGYFSGGPAAASRLAQATGQPPTLATV
jgi:hypothetical protein